MLTSQRNFGRKNKMSFVPFFKLFFSRTVLQCLPGVEKICLEIIIANTINPYIEKINDRGINYHYMIVEAFQWVSGDKRQPDRKKATI